MRRSTDCRAEIDQERTLLALYSAACGESPCTRSPGWNYLKHWQTSRSLRPSPDPALCGTQAAHSQRQNSQHQSK
eukprot:scaffold136944_cov44-Prasinocladus_malaysianus.AAC.1